MAAAQRLALLARPTRGALILDGAHFLYTLLVLTLTWRSEVLCTLLLAGAAAARFSLRAERTEAAIFAVGFVFASLAEIVQVAAGLYTYAERSSLIIPAYNFFLWGSVLCLAHSSLTRLELRLGAALRVSLRQVVAEGGAYLAVTAVLCVLGHRPPLVAALLGGALLLRLLVLRSERDGWFVVLGVLCGPLVENYLVGLGIYRFADPAIGHLPVWHPLYWGIIVLLLRRAVAFVNQLDQAASASSGGRDAF